MRGQGRIAGGSGWVWGRRHAKWERASPSCRLKVVAEQGFWFLWVPYLAAAGVLPFGARGALAESGEPALGVDGVVLHYGARTAHRCHSRVSRNGM